MAGEQLHQASDIFRDYLLSDVEDENIWLRSDIEGLESVAKIEFRLGYGCTVVTADLLRSNTDDKGLYLSAPIDSDPRPLSDFRAGDVVMLGQSFVDFPSEDRLHGNFPRAEFNIVGDPWQGPILAQISLSTDVVLSGEIKGLNQEHERFSLQNPIEQYLRTGVGLDNASDVTFKPTNAIMKGVHQHPLAVVHEYQSCTEEVILGFITKPDEADLHEFSPSDELRLSTLAAVGYTDTQLDLVCQNRNLKIERVCLSVLKGMIGRVKIEHPAFEIQSSVKHAERTGPTLRMVESVNVQKGSILFHNISSLKLFLSIKELAREALLAPPRMLLADDDISTFDAHFTNGVRISGRINPNGEDASTEILTITMEFPVDSVQSILDALE